MPRKTRKDKGTIKIQMAGRRFGRWLVLRRAPNRGLRSIYWLCQCECGKKAEVFGGNLRSGRVVSCGCFNLENVRVINKTHGMSHTREHRAWAAMKQRCYYAKHNRFKNYGGRGITVSERWRDDFATFFADMGLCPLGFSI